MPNSPDLQTLGGRYRLLEHIADGGMASVWRGCDEVLARTVAVKVLHEHLASDETANERFRREAVAAARLTHPGIVGMYDTGSGDGQAWLVMELVEGPTLRRVLDDLGRLPVEHAARIGEQVARALAFAHRRGLVHRDVKPANILIGADGTVKVADFGIAKTADAPGDLTTTGIVLGTAAYVAPEQIRGEPVDSACDQYSLACVLFEALAGQRPFGAGSPLATAAERLEGDAPALRALRPDLPAALEAVLARAMARRPADRFPSADDLADALAAFTEGDAGGTLPLPAVAAGRPPRHGPPSDDAPPSDVGTPARRPGRRRGWRLLVGLLAAAGLAAGLTGVGAGPGWWEDDTAAEIGAGLVLPVEVALFDPGGTGSEQRNARSLPRLLDGDDSTAWQTVGYDTPAFGGLKDGVGFWLDLGVPHALDSIALRTTTPGIRYEVRVAEEPAPALDEWRRVAQEPDVQHLSQAGFREPVVTRYVLVWVTGDLQADGSGRYRAGFSELAVRGSVA